MVEKDIIEKYLGVSYKHMGKSKEEGYDCWTFIKAAYKDLGYILWDIGEAYDEHWSWEGRDLFLNNYKHNWEKVELAKLFDVVLFKNRKGIANHVGIVMTGGRFIHCCKRGVMQSRLFSWKDKIYGFFRLRNK